MSYGKRGVIKSGSQRKCLAVSGLMLVNYLFFKVFFKFELLDNVKNQNGIWKTYEQIKGCS
jgi:hypothetical protein